MLHFGVWEHGGGKEASVAGQAAADNGVIHQMRAAFQPPTPRPV